jgi:hypothetical protein
MLLEPVPLNIKQGSGTKLTTHLRLAPRLRMSVALPPFPTHAFITGSRATLLFYVYFNLLLYLSLRQLYLVLHSNLGRNLVPETEIV